MSKASGKPWTAKCLAGDVKTEVANCRGFKGRFGSIASQPYNREDPDRTVWWLFPRSKFAWGNWPAYSLGKYFFDRPKGRGVIRAGLHVEKGLAPANAAGYGAGKAKHFGMTLKWAWFGFVSDLCSGRVETALSDVAERTGEPVEVEIETGFALDQPELREKFGRHRFSWEKNGRLTLVENIPRPEKLPGIEIVGTLGELGERLRRATDEEPWTWINVVLCSAVPFGKVAPIGAGAEWSGSDFWRNVLEPLADWVK
ncbi:MAG: hypothetical protein ACYC8T_18635 [Myxococcaceae bacterium]